MGKVSKPNFGARLLGQIKEAQAERSRTETAEEREQRLARADAALEQIGPAAGPATTGTPPTIGAPPTDANLATVANVTTVAAPPTVGKPMVEPLVKPTVATTPTVGAPPPVRIAVEPKKGQLRIPNHIVFNLLPQLSLGERAVYLELYAWTHGFGEPERRLSIAKLCRGLGIDYKRFMRIVAELASKGLVEMDERVIGGPRNDRGTVFRVHEPMVLGSTGATPTVGGEPTVGAAPDMKRKHEKHVEKADAAAPAITVYDVRKKAAQIYEARHRDPTFNAVALRTEVRAELGSEGVDVAPEVLDEALRGMV